MNNEKRVSNDPQAGLTPIIVVSDASAAAEFYKRAFNAIEIARIPAPDGKRFMHIRLQVFESVFILMDELPEMYGGKSSFQAPSTIGGTTVTMHLQVSDAEQVWQQAIDANALTVIPLDKQFWGEYYGRLKDPFGHEWTIAQMIENMTDEEVQDAAKEI